MKNIYKLLPLLAIGMILCFPTLSNAQTKCRDKKNKIIPCPKKQTTSKPTEVKWKTFYGNGFNVLMHEKVEEKRIPYGTSYHSSENDKVLGISVGPNTFALGTTPSEKTAESMAVMALKIVPDSYCAPFLNDGVKCRLDFIKATQVEE